MTDFPEIKVPRPDELDLEFYQAVFGWEKGAAHDMGPMSGVYQLFGLNGRDLGGIFNPGRLYPDA